MRVVYLSHVDWAWIKQRPQFLAERLAACGVDVSVHYLPAWRRGVRTGGRAQGARRLPHVPPVTDLLRRRVNPFLRRAWLRGTVRAPDFVWITHPSLLASVPAPWRDRVVYDAMDLVTQFDGKARPADVADEAAALRNARVVFASSEVIARHATATAPGARVHLLRNGLDETQPWPVLQAGGPPPDAGRGPLTYCGTVSSWFDTDALARLRAAVPDLPVVVVGPCEPDMRARLVALDVELTGALPHAQMLPRMSSARVLIMPFVVTPLVEGVDPVKLYEYVASGRPVVSVWYEELAHFEGLVHFYRNLDELPDVFARAQLAPPDLDRARAFALSSTWTGRAREAEAVLADLLRDRSAVR